jgi:hypothetical protein
MKRIEFVRKNKWGVTYSIYECDCGKQFITRDAAVRSGKTRSCGCFKNYPTGEKAHAYKHGHKLNQSPSRTYYSWFNMISRCSNPNYTNFKYWGGKGIKVCEEWKDFSNFLQDMGERPLNTSIDRKDGSKNYSKENCRWATRQQQSENRVFYQKGEENVPH